MGGQHQAPAALPPGKTPIPIVLEAGCAIQLVGKAWKSLPQPGFDLSTVQPLSQSLFQTDKRSLNVTDTAIQRIILYTEFHSMLSELLLGALHVQGGMHLMCFCRNPEKYVGVLSTNDNRISMFVMN
jgi:hypothetical protein